MLKYVTKLTMEIVPSVVATILGAYIVNHYINAKPQTPAAAVAAVAPTAADSAKLEGAKAEGTKADAKPAETSAEMSNIPSAGIKAKGIAEKSVIEKPAEAKPAEGKSERSTETASLPAEKARAATSKSVRPAEIQEEHRDATDLARAAIERLRASEGSRSSEASRAEQSRIATVAPQVSPVRPLPPPVSVSTPQGAAYGAVNPAFTGSVQADGRVTPPGEIPEPPPARPLDLRADRGDPSLKDQVSNVAQDMVSAAKSVFHSVLPK
jgi:hypothetical protein